MIIFNSIKESRLYHKNIQGSGKNKRVTKSDLISKLVTPEIGHCSPNNPITTFRITMDSEIVWTKIISPYYTEADHHITFKKINTDMFLYLSPTEPDKMFKWINNEWYINDYKYKNDSTFYTLLSYLSKITIFLEIRRLYAHITIIKAHLIPDIVKYCGRLLIDYHDLYNIIVK